MRLKKTFAGVLAAALMLFLRSAPIRKGRKGTVAS